MTNDAEKEAGSKILRCYGDFFKKQYQDYTSFLEERSKDENKSFTPIQVVMMSRELISTTDLVASDNIVITKVLGVLSSLCIEIHELKKEAFERCVALRIKICQ